MAGFASCPQPPQSTSKNPPPNDARWQLTCGQIEERYCPVYAGGGRLAGMGASRCADEHAQCNSTHQYRWNARGPTINVLADGEPVGSHQ